MKASAAGQKRWPGSMRPCQMTVMKSRCAPHADPDRGISHKGGRRPGRKGAGTSMRPIAIVTPWFDADLTGGAEQQAFQVATRLAARGHNVEVLATCNRSFHSDWATDHYAPGVTYEHGLKVRRFSVDPRDAATFGRVNDRLLAVDPADLRAGVNPGTDEEAETFVHENIKSA